MSFKTAPINDPDTFWHLRTGAWLRDTWQFVGPDPFTDTASRDWILHEWLLEVGSSLAYDAGGMAGVVWFYAGLVGLVLFAIYLVCRQRASIAVSGLVVLLTMLAMSASLTPRPHLATYALMAVTVHGWLRSVEDGKPRWWLVVLPWVWVSTHGMWFLGAVVAGMILIGGLLDRRLPGRRLLRLGLLWLLSIGAASLGPAGWHALIAPLQVSDVTRFISEWDPPDPRDAYYSVFLAIAGGVVILWARSMHRVPWRYIAVLAAAVGLATMGARFVAVSAAMLAPVAALSAQSAVGFVRERVGRLEVVGLVLAAVASAGLSGAVAAGLSQASTWGPNSMLSDIRALPEAAVVCNDQQVGGWLLWHVPHVRPIIDGRLELFAEPFVERQLAWQLRGVQGAVFPSDLGCDAVLVSSDSMVPGHLTRAGWSLADQGDDYVLYVK